MSVRPSPPLRSVCSAQLTLDSRSQRQPLLWESGLCTCTPEPLPGVGLDWGSVGREEVKVSPERPGGLAVWD